MSSNTGVLVFPGGMLRSEGFCKAMHNVGVRVVEASSEAGQLIAKGYRYLPYITDDDFLSSFVSLLQEEGICKVYAPHPGVWWKLRSLSEDPRFHIRFDVVNDQPHTEDRARQALAYEWARACVETAPLVPDASPSLAIERYANLYWSYSAIPGESDDDKMWLLSQVFRLAVPGDVVEIGCAYGRSAFALSWLAQFHRIGSVVCVDPWDLPSSSDQGGEAALINQAVLDVDWQAVHRSFIAALAGFSHVNYIRKPSALAISDYRDAMVEGGVETPEFGRTAVSGGISILHIDGNHRYEEVCQDIANWLPLVKPGGWVLLDDYLWAFGDGPRKAGDELLERIAVEQAFVVGDTLCIRLPAVTPQ